MYVLYDPSKPYLMLDFADSLSELASALAARQFSGDVRKSQGGHTLALTDAEQRELDERVRELRSLTGEP